MPIVDRIIKDSLAYSSNRRFFPKQIDCLIGKSFFVVQHTAQVVLRATFRFLFAPFFLRRKKRKGGSPAKKTQPLLLGGPLLHAIGKIEMAWQIKILLILSIFDIVEQGKVNGK